jgi:hypothetical protein
VDLHALNASGTVSAQFILKVLPIVSLKATIPEVTEGSDAKGKFTVAVSSAHTQEIIVHYEIEGDAINGTDYEKLPGTVKLKPGELSKAIYIVPVGDLEGMAEKTVKIKLETNSAYLIETTAPEKVKILAGE